MQFEASWAIFWLLSGYKKLNHSTKPFTSWHFEPSVPDAKYPLLNFGQVQKEKFRDMFKSDTRVHVAVLTFTFHFLSSPVLYFSHLIFSFSFVGQLLGFI